MVKYKLEHNRPNCIGCGACVAINEKHWEMNDDGKSGIRGGKKRSDGWQELEIDEKELAVNKEAAESCPVNGIHITNKETGKKII